MPTLATIVAFSWDPEIRGVLFVLIAVVVLMGSTYLILSTNVGFRQGLLLSLAAFFGWMACMGAIWATYGIGLQGRMPAWVGQDIVNDGNLANASSDVIRNPDIVNATTTDEVDGWILLEVDDPKRGQAIASADDIVVNQAEILAAGQFEATNVWDKGGERFPFHLEWDAPNWWPGVDEGDTWQFDWLAFWHEPHYSLVELRSFVPQETEPGRAPPRPIVDESQPPRYVLMERDLGTRRQPAFLITIGSTLIFGVLCFMLHQRDALVERNRRTTDEPAKVPAKVPAGAGV
jgi:hypothetical protein